MLQFVSFACNGSKLCELAAPAAVKSLCWTHHFPDLLGKVPVCLSFSRTRALGRVLQSPRSLAPFYCCATILISVVKWVIFWLSPRISVHQWCSDMYGRELCKKRKDVVSMACCNLLAGPVLISDACGWCYQHTALLCLFINEFESSEVIKLTRAFVAQTYTGKEQELPLILGK